MLSLHTFIVIHQPSTFNILAGRNTLYVVTGKWQNINIGQIKSELQPAPVMSHRGRQEQCLLLSGQSQPNLRILTQISKILQKEPAEETIYGLHGDSLRYFIIIKTSTSLEMRCLILLWAGHQTRLSVGRGCSKSETDLRRISEGPPPGLGNIYKGSQRKNLKKEKLIS